MKALKVIGIALVALLVVAAALLIRPDFSKDDLKEYWQPPSQFMTLPSGAVAHYRDQGTADGPVLVLIHGGLASLHTWEPWIAILGQHYRIITVDMPGHGLTGRIPGDIYSRANMVAFLHEFVNKLGLDHFILGGNSMGGGISTNYTLEHPEKVHGLISVAGGGVPTDLDSADSAEGADNLGIDIEGVVVPGQPVPDKLNTELSASEWLFSKLASRLAVAEGLKYVVYDDSLITDAMIDRYADLRRYDGIRYAQSIMWQHYYVGVPAGDLEPRFAEIQVPTLLLWGDKDELVPVSAAHRFDQGIADSTLIIYPNVGHVLMEEIPEQSSHDVHDFIQAKIVGSHD